MEVFATKCGLILRAAGLAGLLMVPAGAQAGGLPTVPQFLKATSEQQTSVTLTVSDVMAGPTPATWQSARLDVRMFPAAATRSATSAARCEAAVPAARRSRMEGEAA